MGFEYMFFNAALRDRFIAFVADHGVTSTTRQDPIAGFVVELPDGLADDLQDTIEDEYDSIMDEQMLLAEADEELVSHHAFGITVTLEDGTTRAVRIPPAIARRLLAHFTPGEVHEITSAIVQSAENPVDGPICHKPPQ